MKTKINGILTLLLVFMVQMTFAQERTISGVVSDEMGPVADISVKVKGTTRGTVTDFDGNYAIKAKTGDVIEFTHVSYATVTKTVGASSKIDVMVKESGESLGEVVVTGVAGKTSRKKLSVTVNKVSQKDLEFVPTSSAESVLQGKVAGVTVTNLGQPGDGANIQLRGATNLFGSQAPLIVVDGVIVEGGLADINSDDIASFEIVKGASASAMYGSRAGNGVVVISTKKGKNGKVKVSFKSETGFSNINNFMALNQSHHYIMADDWQDYEGKYTKYANVTYPVDYNGYDYRDVIGTRLEEDDHYSDNKFGVYHNPQKQFFRTGKNTTLFASISSGSEKSKVYFSGEKTTNEGVLKETKGYERVSARLNAELKVNDWITFNASNNYIRTNNHTPGGTDGIFFQLSVTDPDVNLEVPNADGQPYLYVPSKFAQNTTNPIYPLYANSELRKQNKFLGAYKVNLKFTDYLDFDTEYSLEMISSKTTEFTSSDTYARTGGELQDFYALKSTGNYYLANYNNLSQKTQFSLNFNKKYGDLGVKSKLSYLIEDSQYNSFYGYGADEIFKGPITLDNYDTKFIGSNRSDETAKNFFAIVGLDYKDRYILDGMYRMDSSSLFGENNRDHSYYRVSGAYRISKDLNIDKIQELKVHAAIGTAGQRPGYNWQYPRIPIFNGNLSTDRFKANPDLKPSTTTEIEFGLTSSFLNRVDFDLVYSQATTENQFMSVNIPAQENDGNNKQWKNIGTVAFNTIESSINVKILKDTKLKWNSGLVFDKTVNEITQLDVNPITVGPDEGEVFRIEEGQEFGAMYGYRFVRTLDEMKNQLPTGTTIDDFAVNRDGIVVLKSSIGTVNEGRYNGSAIYLLDENGDRFYGKIGKQTPDFKVGFNNTFSYKGFNFYTLIDWKQGGDIYNKTGQWLTRDNRSGMVDQSSYADNEKKTTDYYQVLYDANQYNEFWVEDGTYVKLREASLFYTINKDQLSNVANGFFDSMRIGITGTNLLTFTNYSGWDPEVQSYDSDTLQSYSVDYNTYPVSSTYTFSFMLKF